MIYRTIPENDYMQTKLIWFIELEYHGLIHRFATETINLSDNDGKSYLYIGTLENIEISQEMGFVNQISIQSDSVAIALTFPNRNISKEIYNGKTLEGGAVKLGYVLVRHGQIQNNFDERPIVYLGSISEPVYGYPDKPIGYVEFSVENRAIYTDTSLLSSILGENLYINDVALTPNPDIGQSPPFPVINSIVNVSDIHRGKIVPFVFGRLEGILRENNQSANIPISPAYVIAYDTGGAKPCYYVIAGHSTNASTVKVYDNIGNTDTATVNQFVNIDNLAFSYISLDQTSPISQSVAPNNDRQVWVQWNNGGPFTNPYNTGDLEGGADICLYLLSLISSDIDINSWVALRAILNEYVFGGYVNDDEITCYQFLQKNIVAYLPISIVNGPNGLKPILDLFLDGAELKPRVYVIAGPGFYRTGPILAQNSINDIINEVNIRYGINGVTQSTSAKISISNQDSPIPHLGHGVSALSEFSIKKFGRRPKTITLDYCYDWRTANKIAQNIIQTNAFLIQTMSYSATVDYGYLEIGDIIEITDDDLGFYNLKAQIISKTFITDSWLFKIKLDNNPYRRAKTDV